MRRILLIFLVTCLIFSCQIDKNKSSDPDREATSVNSKGNPILRELMQVKGKGILFGHQDDLAYGIDWKYIEGESDVKRVSGDYPALFGWELGGIERGDLSNLDSVPFDRMKALALKAHEMGGINTFSWHPYEPISGQNSWTNDVEVVRHILPGGSHHREFKKQLDRIGAFFQSLQTSSGEQMAFIFRPWHEMDGNWFWWGRGQCTPEEFRSLFSFTIDYLKNEKGLKNMLVAYSPDRNFDSAEVYLTWYPGDEWIDILGMDNYYDLKQDEGHLKVIEKLHLVIDLAEKRKKLSAFTETGLENVTDPGWYENSLGKVLSDSLISKEISYVMVWRNDPKVHFFFPYPGHPGADSAKRVLAQKNILLLQDFNELKE